MATPRTSPRLRSAHPLADDYEGNLLRNQAYIAPGAHTFNTPLPPADESKFREWLVQAKVPFDPEAMVSDYDMRGFWAALQKGDPIAKSAIDPNDSKWHYPDYWKTPLHQTFSAESQWANPKTAPKWNHQDQLVSPGGAVVFDDRRH